MTFGTPVPTLTDKERTKDVPGLGWEISEETKKEIEAINENIRQAAIMAPYLMFD